MKLKLFYTSPESEILTFLVEDTFLASTYGSNNAAGPELEEEDEYEI